MLRSHPFNTPISWAHRGLRCRRTRVAADDDGRTSKYLDGYSMTDWTFMSLFAPGWRRCVHEDVPGASPMISFAGTRLSGATHEEELGRCPSLQLSRKTVFLFLRLGPGLVQLEAFSYIGMGSPLPSASARSLAWVARA